MPGAEDAFEARNYRTMTTTPKQEWQYVVGGQALLPEHEVAGKRALVAIDELMALKTVEEAKLTRAEVIAIVLYTGPMVSGGGLVCGTVWSDRLMS